MLRINSSVKRVYTRNKQSKYTEAKSKFEDQIFHNKYVKDKFKCKIGFIWETNTT